MTLFKRVLSFFSEMESRWEDKEKERESEGGGIEGRRQTEGKAGMKKASRRNQRD